jgi:hypothetical protein
MLLIYSVVGHQKPFGIAPLQPPHCPRGSENAEILQKTKAIIRESTKCRIDELDLDLFTGDGIQIENSHPQPRNVPLSLTAMRIRRHCAAPK